MDSGDIAARFGAIDPPTSDQISRVIEDARSCALVDLAADLAMQRARQLAMTCADKPGPEPWQGKAR